MVSRLDELSKQIKEEIADLYKAGIEKKEKKYNSILQFLSVASEYKIKPLSIKLEGEQKSVDVLLDILKLLIL